MGAVLLLLMPALRGFLPNSGTDKIEAIFLLAAGIILGTISYLAAATLLRSQEVAQALSMLMRRIRR